MIVNGNLIAQNIKNELKSQIAGLSTPLSVAIVYVGNNPASESFISRKIKFGSDIGVAVDVHSFKDDVSQEKLVEHVREISEGKKYQGIVVQLPLPETLDTDKVLNIVPSEKDIDVLSETVVQMFKEGKIDILPPVAGAVKEVLTYADVLLENKNIVIVGKGRLVGAPVYDMFKNEGMKSATLEEGGEDFYKIIKEADAIISGTGVSGLIKPDMIKEGVVIIDAGTSELKGKLSGDADPQCVEKASVFTPVPGGIGPITVAVLFKNLLLLAEKTYNKR